MKPILLVLSAIDLFGLTAGCLRVLWKSLHTKKAGWHVANDVTASYPNSPIDHADEVVFAFNRQQVITFTYYATTRNMGS